MIKKILKSILKYPLIIINRIYIFIYYYIVGNREEYKEMDIGENKNIIVLSPHVDDETIGLGGSIIKLGKMGSKMTLIYLTDGSGSTSDKSKSQLIEERREEGIAVKESYGFNELYFLDQVDGELNSNSDSLIDELKKIISREKPDAIFSPFLIDGNKDHFETTKALSKALESMDIDFNHIYLYEVNNLIHPELVNIVSILEDSIYRGKKDKYSIFKSQWAMGFSIYELMDYARGINYKSKEKVEPFVKLNHRQLKHAIKSLENNEFNPEDFKQISSEFTFIPGVFKNKASKNKYNRIIMKLIEK